MSYGDNPIDTLDQDHLNRAGTVQALQTLLTDPHLDTPLALGIYGDWGSGKTSVMRLLKKALSGHGLCLWFDAWQYAHQQDALWRALMLAVVEGLRQHQPEGLNDEALNRLVTSLYRSQQYVDKKGFKINWQAAVPLTVRAILRLLPVVGVSLGDKVAEKLQESLAEGKDAEEAVRLIERENIQHYREQVQSLEQFQQELRGLIKNHVTDKGRRLYLFIDDLDRCLPEAAVGVLEAVKLFLNIPGCLFILGMDRHVVEQGIRVRYKEFALTLPATAHPMDARQYLDKIIQIPFALPPLSEPQIQRFVEQWCEDHQQLTLRECAPLIVAGVAPNPRSIKRTLNVLHVVRTLGEIQNRPLESDDLKRLAKLVVLQTSYDTFYRDAVAKPGLLREWELAA